MDTYFEHTLVTGIAPAFYKSSKKTSKSNTIKRCSRILQIYGVIIHSVILHLITLIIYCAMGAILRHTMFPFNMKKTYGVNDDITNYHSNDTMMSNGTEINQGEQSYLDEILFEEPLHGFPIQFVGGYIICIAIYILLSAIYYRAFHPWKVIIWEKMSNKRVQEFEMDRIEQQDENESSTDEEVSHL